MAFAPEVVQRARAARDVTRREAVLAHATASDATTSPSDAAESGTKKAKSKGKTTGDKEDAEEKKNKKPATFKVAPRWAVVGTPPSKLKQELEEQTPPASQTQPAAGAGPRAGVAAQAERRL